MASLYDPNNPSNDLCQLGLNTTETSSFSNLLNTLLAKYSASFTEPSKPILKSVNNRSKLMATVSSAITCNVLNKMGAGMVALNVSQLLSISSSDFYNCRAVLGSSNNLWSASQLTALASNTKSVYHLFFCFNFRNFITK
jgi:hypothetical protein